MQEVIQNVEIFIQKLLEMLSPPFQDAQIIRDEGESIFCEEGLGRCPDWSTNFLCGSIKMAQVSSISMSLHFTCFLLPPFVFQLSKSLSAIFHAFQVCPFLTANHLIFKVQACCPFLVNLFPNFRVVLVKPGLVGSLRVPNDFFCHLQDGLFEDVSGFVNVTQVGGITKKFIDTGRIE